MNSEMETKLQNYKDELEAKITSLNVELKTIVGNPSKSKEEEKQAKKINKKLNNLNAKYQKAVDYLGQIKNSNTNLDKLNDSLNRATSESRKQNLQNRIDKENENLKELIKSIEKNCDFSLEDKFNLGEFISSHKKETALTLAGLAGVGVLSFSGVKMAASAMNKNNTVDKNPDASNSLDLKETPSIDPSLGIIESAEPTISENIDQNSNNNNNTNSNNNDNNNNTNSNSNDNNNSQNNINSNIPALTDINDEEQVARRANYIVENYYNVLAPNSGKTVDDVIEDLKQLNGGIVEDASLDRASFTIDTINDLMFCEMAASVDILNEVKTTREKSEVLVDYSVFFIDESLGQKLASKITSLRSSMIINAAGDVSKYRKEFVELFMQSWILHGNTGREINAYTLETPGMEAMIDLMFLNTSPLVGDSDKLVIENPLTMENITFTEILNMANYEDCPTTLEDGTKITLDKSSSDLYAMYQTNAINKRDANSLTLK